MSWTDGVRMLVLLPPSETKRSGGSEAPLEVGALSLPPLAPQRDRVIDALVRLSGDEELAARVLRLSRSQRGQIAVNSRLRESPTLPAVDRYTGVLFEALGAASLDAQARRWLGRHALVHSAPFGPVGALDPIPEYRLGAAASLPGLGSLRSVWADAVSSAISLAGPTFVLDLRSEAYVALGPVPASVPSSYIRVVSAGADGAVRALNHFNKHAKGDLVRALATSRPRVGSAAGLRRWADAAGFAMRFGARGELELVL